MVVSISESTTSEQDMLCLSAGESKASDCVGALAPEL
jgi:hypothetical protein